MTCPARRARASIFLATSSVTLLFTCSLVLRAAQPKTAIGVITSKTSKPASVYKQYPSGRRGGLSEPAEIPIAESVVFEIKVARLGTVRYSTNTIAAKEFDIGQKVEIEYVKRAIMPLRPRIYVTAIRHAK
jgi:hypothetical protein